eukprot:jgi/Chlat1/5944/Chrsp4S06263
MELVQQQQQETPASSSVFLPQPAVIRLPVGAVLCLGRGIGDPALVADADETVSRCQLKLQVQEESGAIKLWATTLGTNPCMVIFKDPARLLAYPKADGIAGVLFLPKRQSAELRPGDQLSLSIEKPVMFELRTSERCVPASASEWAQPEYNARDASTVPTTAVTLKTHLEDASSVAAVASLLTRLADVANEVPTTSRADDAGDDVDLEGKYLGLVVEGHEFDAYDDRPQGRWTAFIGKLIPDDSQSGRPSKRFKRPDEDDDYWTDSEPSYDDRNHSVEDDGVASDEDDDDEDLSSELDTSQSSEAILQSSQQPATTIGESHTSDKPMCIYGSNCFRSNAHHHQSFRHPDA